MSAADWRMCAVFPSRAILFRFAVFKDADG